MDDPNVTMEEYIRLEEEKAQRHGQTFNWQTATFRKVKYYEDNDDCFTDFETEFPAIVFDNTLTSDIALPCEPTVSPPNENKIDFRISLDESDDEDYTPMVDYLDDLDYFNDFENEFPAIVYNDGLTSKSDLEIEPPVSSEHVSKSETSLSKYDEEEQNVLHFSNSFPLDEIFPNDPKTIKDSDDDIDKAQPYRCNKVNRSNELSRKNHDKSNKFGIPFDPKRYYKDDSHTNIAEAKIWHLYLLQIRHTLGSDTRLRDTPRDLAVRLRMVYTRGEGKQVFVSYVWRRLFRIRAPLVREFILEFLSTCRMSDTKMGMDVADTLCFQLGGVKRRMTWTQFILVLGLHTEQEMTKVGFGAYWDGSDRLIPDKGDLRDYWIEISFDKDFFGPALLFVFYSRPCGGDCCHRMINYILLVRGTANRMGGSGYYSWAVGRHEIIWMNDCIGFSNEGISRGMKDTKNMGRLGASEGSSREVARGEWDEGATKEASYRNLECNKEEEACMA
ncbi:hypothetical protein Tco_0051245 [Tanacetum coccineum]